MAPAPRPAEISSNISRAFTIPIACIRPWAISAQPSLSVWRPNPVHFFGEDHEGGDEGLHLFLGRLDRRGEHDARPLEVLARPVAVGRDHRQLLAICGAQNHTYLLCHSLIPKTVAQYRTSEDSTNSLNDS